MDDYLHLRTNPEGPLDEFWQHEQGCRAWLIVTRDTGTHEVLGVRLAQDIAGGDDAA
jgi:heterotetrameric sarcosine oxidase delta subunit